MTQPASPLLVAEELLAPIRDDAPAGDSLRYEEPYRQIQAARTSDAGLPQGVWQRAERRSDWREVERLSAGVLKDRSKDLQVAVWLGEAWIHTRNLEGLLAGLELIAGLHERFLITMYPRTEGADTLSPDTIEHRCNLIQSYNERVALALKFLPVSAPSDLEQTPHSVADVEKAVHDDVMRRRMNADPPAEPPAERFEKNMRSSSAEWLTSTDARLREAQASAVALDGVLDQAYGAQNGGLGEIVRVLGAVRALLQPYLPVDEPPMLESLPPIAPDVPPMPESAEEFSGRPQHRSENVGYDVGANQEPSSSSVSMQPLPASGTVTGRSQAFAQLKEIADFLARTEPHSPVPFLLRRAIRWGSMDFHELLPELMRHPEVLEELQSPVTGE